MLQNEASWLRRGPPGLLVQSKLRGMDAARKSVDLERRFKRVQNGRFNILQEKDLPRQMVFIMVPLTDFDVLLLYCDSMTYEIISNVSNPNLEFYRAGLCPHSHMATIEPTDLHGAIGQAKHMTRPELHIPRLFDSRETGNPCATPDPGSGS